MARGDRLTQYDGCCEKYGQTTVALFGFGGPVLLNTFALAATDSAYLGTVIATTALSLLGATRGFSAACDEHFRIQKIASKNKTPLSTGNKIVEKAQIKAFFKKAAPALLFNLCVLSPIASHYEEDLWDGKSLDETILEFVKS